VGLAGSLAEVVGPDDQPQDGLPPEQLGEGDGEQPADEPEDACAGIHADGFGRGSAWVRPCEPPFIFY
jgi:hypothetical protein